jgi:hypothetical protein
MKVMVCHFVSDSHEVMTALIVMLPLIVVVEISLQLHRSFKSLSVFCLPCFSVFLLVFYFFLLFVLIPFLFFMTFFGYL